MINLRLLGNIIVIALLVLLQVFIFNKMIFAQTAIPLVYIIFILIYPPQRNRYLFLTLCFLLGLGIDIFESTGGIHAFSSITIGFLSRYFIRLISGTRFFEIEEFSFSDFSAGQWFVYSVLMVVIHHFFLFLLESFSFSNFSEILLRAIYCSAYTLIFVFFYLILFIKREER